MDTNPNAHRTSGLLPPLSVVIQWPTPNYEDPVTRSKTVPITFCVLGTIMVAVVGVRIWARAVIQRNAGSDDWIMVAAMVPTIGLTVITCLATEHFSFNRHIWDVRPSLYIPERKLTFALYCLYIISGSMIKISILLFYRRLNKRSITRTFRVATWINIIGIAVFCSSFVLILFLACDPFSAFWNQFDMVRQATGYEYHCWVDEAADLLSASIISAVQDAIAAFLPTILYWNLQIPRRQKVALGAIFALGYVVCIVAGVRSYYVWRIFNDPLYDSTWNSWPAWLLCVLEVQLGAICASAPALKVFLAHYFKIATTKYVSSKRSQESALRKDSWWKNNGSKSSATKESRNRWVEDTGREHTVDEEGGILLVEHKGAYNRYDGRTESMETFIYI